MNTKKLDNFILEITKPAPIAEPIKQTFEREFIEKQIIAITKQRDDMIASKEAELAECQSILAEMDKLGIEVRPKEEDGIFNGQEL